VRKRIIKPKDVALEASEVIDRMTMPHQPVTEEKKTPYKAVKEKKSVTEKKPKAYPSHVDNPEREMTEFEMFLLAKESTAKFV